MDFEAIFESYKGHEDITQTRLFLEKMESVLSTVSNKIIIDSNLDGVLPLLNLDHSGGDAK